MQFRRDRCHRQSDQPRNVRYFRHDGICTAGTCLYCNRVWHFQSGKSDRVHEADGGNHSVFSAWCSLLAPVSGGDAVDGLFDPGAVSGKRQKAAGRRCHIRLPCLGAAPASWHGRHSTAFVGVGDYLHSYYHRAFVCERCKDFWQICL